MGLFDGMSGNRVENAWCEDIANDLQPQNGHIHVLMIQSFSKIADQNFDSDTKYDSEINDVLERVQATGRQIVDVRFAIIRDQGFSGLRTGYRTMIIYK